MYMVFLILGNKVSRSEPLNTIDEAFDFVKSSLPGSRFDISDITTNNYKLILSGYVG